MKQEIPIQMALANVHGQVNPEDIYRFIETNSDNIETYWLDPDRIRDLQTKGHIIGAAIDYLVLLNAGANVATIATLFWMAYKEFIEKKKQSLMDDSGLYISIENPDGTRYNFWLGNDYKERDIFINEFTERVAEAQQFPEASRNTKKFMFQIKNDPLWARRK